MNQAENRDLKASDPDLSETAIRKFLHIQMPPLWTERSLAKFRNSALTWTQDTTCGILLDFLKCTEISCQDLRWIAHSLQAIQEKGKTVHSIRIHSDLAKKIDADGLHSAYNTQELATRRAPTLQEWITSLQRSLGELLSIQYGFTSNSHLTKVARPPWATKPDARLPVSSPAARAVLRFGSAGPIDAVMILPLPTLTQLDKQGQNRGHPPIRDVQDFVAELMTTLLGCLRSDLSLNRELELQSSTLPTSIAEGEELQPAGKGEWFEGEIAPPPTERTQAANHQNYYVGVYGLTG